MMDRLRDGANSVAIKVILGVIILSFIFTGVSGYLGGGAAAAAKVGDVEISRGEFEQAYQNERNRMQAQLGDYFATLLGDPSYAQQFRKSVLDRMINDILLEQHAKSLGLRISDEQVRQMIVEMPYFQNDGKFDQEIYAQALRRAGFTPEGYAETVRRDEVRNQLLLALQGSEFSLPSEVESQGLLITQQRDIRTLTLDVEKFAANVEISDEELQTYYQQNPAQFTRPEQVKVGYVELSAAALKDQISVSEEQAKTYYDEHLALYSTEEQRKLSHILVQGDDEAKAQAILDEINAGADFVQVAQEKSEDPGSAEEGGSLGWIERGATDPAFEEAAFALQNAGEMTGLVKSGFGYHIIKLDELKAPEAKPFEQVAADITQELQDSQAIERFYELQTELERVAFEFPDSLEDAAQAIDGTVVNTDFVSQADAPQVLLTPSVMQAILDPEVKDTGLNSAVVEVAPEHVIVVRVDDQRDETVLPLEEVKAQAQELAAKAKAEKQASELGESLIAELKEGNTSSLEANELAFGESESIDRGNPLANTVFAMVKPAEGQPEFAKTQDMQGNIVIVELTGVKAEIEPAYNEQIGAQLVRTTAQQDLEATLTTLRNEADIEYYVVETN
ncbi:peptidylprolyl isomerase [Vibrio sp. SCSIO 43136]|uniref:peptidylprolyl isomerase n=1 Tax=Vibrio sp. SCSIO 43136 TaxID=2819101 RepID=UPI0020758940|nr:peptidylprolyl isomerase [Vibrio sp. SCSIO 43136]USD64472.1 peptidylprolyl isomerase [Vibrio sp. SCSIO 43136]